jgi:hypothetical protein
MGEKRGDRMHETLRPLIHKAPVTGLRVHVGRAGLCLGDAAQALMMDDGSVGIMAEVKRPFLGVVPRRRQMILGTLGPAASRILRPEIDFGRPLRLRIVGLTPEHLAGPDGPEVHISAWGSPGPGS